MAKITLKNLSELKKYVDARVKESLKDDVAPVVKEKMQQNIETMVYSYEPKRYNRTGQLKEDIDILEVKEGVAIVPARTDEDSGKYIPSVIETGVGYDYTGYGYEYEQPRPFVHETKEDIVREGIHKSELIKSLKNKGFDIR